MAAIVPLVLVLWENTHFGGIKRVYITNDPDLTSDALPVSTNFNDTASSIGVHPGPNFVAGHTVSVFSDTYFKGQEMVLLPGIYPDLTLVKFNDSISSVQFNAPGYPKAPGIYVNGQLDVPLGQPAPAAAIAPIPVIVALYREHDRTEGLLGPTTHGAHVVTLVESSLDLGADYGGEFSASADNVRVIAGPDPTGIARLYRETNPDTPAGHRQGGGHIDLSPVAGDPNPLHELSVSASNINLADYGFAKQTRAVVIEFVKSSSPNSQVTHRAPTG